MLYCLCRLYILLLPSDKEFTDALGSFSSIISLLLIFQAPYVSLVAELVQWIFYLFFEDKDPISVSPSSIEQDLND